MAHIKKISFNRVGRTEGCTCDRCGQYLQNIWTVEYTDGIRMNFGIDCFEKLNKESRLNAYGMKEMKKALKSIEQHQEWFEAEKKMTEEEDIRWQNIQEDKMDYWYGKPYAEYKKWMLEEFWQERFKEDQKRIDRFSKINFQR